MYYHVQDACVPREFHEALEQVRRSRPEFRVQLGGFMNARDMCKADSKSHTEAWKKDPVLVFINFIEDRNIKVFDMFKLFDKDKSCTLTRDEFKTGLSRIGCPLKPKEVNHLLDALDSDRSGEIDIMYDILLELDTLYAIYTLSVGTPDLTRLVIEAIRASLVKSMFGACVDWSINCIRYNCLLSFSVYILCWTLERVLLSYCY